MTVCTVSLSQCLTIGVCKYCSLLQYCVLRSDALLCIVGKHSSQHVLRGSDCIVDVIDVGMRVALLAYVLYGASLILTCTNNLYMLPHNTA